MVILCIWITACETYTTHSLCVAIYPGTIEEDTNLKNAQKNQTRPQDSKLHEKDDLKQ